MNHTFSIRMTSEDRAQLAEAAEKVNLVPADLIRAGARALLTACEENGGKLELPVHVRTKKDEQACLKLANLIKTIADDLAMTFDHGYPEESEAKKERMARVAQTYKIAVSASEILASMKAESAHEITESAKNLLSNRLHLQ